MSQARKKNKNTIFETIKLRTKRLELLRDYSHFCLREDCLPISTCSLFLVNIILRINYYASLSNSFNNINYNIYFKAIKSLYSYLYCQCKQLMQYKEKKNIYKSEANRTPTNSFGDRYTTIILRSFCLSCIIKKKQLQLHWRYNYLLMQLKKKFFGERQIRTIIIILQI